MNKIKALIISVGGTSAPVVTSINQQQPDYIFFFASEQTRNDIDQIILPALTYKHKAYDLIITPSAEGLSECYRVIYEALPGIMQKWQIKPAELVVDYTGGTKTMSSALVLATIEISSYFSYIGGAERTKKGVGIVVDGKEKMLFQDNPWNELAISAKKEITILFNKARYLSAQELARKFADKVSPDLKVLFTSLADIIEGYYEWDNFNHKGARDKIGKGLSKFKAYADGANTKTLRMLAQDVENSLNWLKQVNKESIQICYDLIANARRRAELEHKYDDAMARLYRATEAIAQLNLQRDYQINTSDVKQEQIPEHIRTEFLQKYKSPDVESGKDKIKIGLHASYRLLKEKGNAVGEKFISAYDEKLRTLLNLRNNSILAHGFGSIKKEQFDEMLEIVFRFTDIKQKDLPAFPEMKL